MKLKRIILSALAIFGFAAASYAQDIEGGIMIGITEYQGDLSPKQITFSQTKPSFGILGRYYFGPRVDVKANIYYGWIEGTDKDNDQYWAKRRDLSFKSSVLDFGIQGELNMLPFISNSKRYRFAPYLFVGVNGYHFNPTAIDPQTNSSVDLAPLKTEGQGTAYSTWQLAIPYGIGLKYSIGNFWNVGIEIGQRKLFTDYLDDVSGKYPTIDYSKYSTSQSIRMTDPGYLSDPAKIPKNESMKQRGNDGKDDMYLFAGFTITKTIRRFSCTNF